MVNKTRRLFSGSIHWPNSRNKSSSAYFPTNSTNAMPSSVIPYHLPRCAAAPARSTRQLSQQRGGNTRFVARLPAEAKLHSLSLSALPPRQLRRPAHERAVRVSRTSDHGEESQIAKTRELQRADAEAAGDGSGQARCPARNAPAARISAASPRPSSPSAAAATSPVASAVIPSPPSLDTRNLPSVIEVMGPDAAMN